ncbi:DUF3880 domain-containing protein [Lachnospiraceae bacterium 45-W7]
MKLLFYRYGSICEPDIILGFQELGHTVLEITAEMSGPALTPQESIQIFSNQLLAQPVDFVFSINFFPFVSEVCNIFKLPYLCWTVDSPVMELFTGSVSHPWNRIFLFDRAQYQEISPLNPGRVFHLPLAVNIVQKQNIIQKTSAKMHPEFSSDVSFVGSLYTEKCPYDKLSEPPDYLCGYLEGLMEAQIRIYGGFLIEELLPEQIIQDFKQHLPGFFTNPFATHLTDRQTVAQLYIGNKISSMERLRALEALSTRFSVDLYTASDASCLAQIHNRGLANTLEEMPLIFHNSKINLNITSKSIRSGIPLRIFDILGCGGFALTNFQLELPELFLVGEDLVCYENMEDLICKTDYFLRHESERLEIAEKGFETVKKYHTYPLRLEKMLHLAFSRNDASIPAE